MRTNYAYFFTLLLALPAFLIFSCSNDETSREEPMLIVKFQFDNDYERLDNLAAAYPVTPGHAAQTPIINKVAAHFLELAPDKFTKLGEGTVLYHAPETSQGGEKAIDFSQAKLVGAGDTFIKIPLSKVASGNYNWVRLSLSYQNLGLRFLQSGREYTGTMANFPGFRTFIGSHAIGNNFFEINANKEKGYWAFALDNNPFSAEGQSLNEHSTSGSTTSAAADSNVISGKFLKEFQITGSETKDVVVTLSLSTANSFVWREVNFDGRFEPSAGEVISDVGFRTITPSFSISN